MQAGMSREKGRAKTEKKRKEERKRGREEEKTYLEHRRERGADRIHVVPPADQPHNGPDGEGHRAELLKVSRGRLNVVAFFDRGG